MSEFAVVSALSQEVEAGLRALHDFISQPELAEELAQGKEEFFQRVIAPLPGESIEELRLASFVEWFIFDRQLRSSGRTPVEEYLRRHAEELSGERREVFIGFARTVHSVFQVQAREDRIMDLLDLYSRRRYPGVRRVPLTLSKGDLAELRLVPVSDFWFATDALCYHPYFAKKAIARRLKAAAKKGEPIEDLLLQLMAINTKYERYPKTAKRTAYEQGLAPVSRT